MRSSLQSCQPEGWDDEYYCHGTRAERTLSAKAETQAAATAAVASDM